MVRQRLDPAELVRTKSTSTTSMRNAVCFAARKHMVHVATVRTASMSTAMAVSADSADQPLMAPARLVRLVRMNAETRFFQTTLKN